jgi:hypothetical protein
MDQLQILPCCTLHSLQHLERIVVELECVRIQHGRGRSVPQMSDYITHATTTSHTHTCNAFPLTLACTGVALDGCTT